MKTMSAREAKNAFGLMIDTARAEPVLIEKHGRGVVMVIAVEEYERLMTQGDALGKGHALVTRTEKNAERNLHRDRTRSASEGRGTLSDGSPQRTLRVSNSLTANESVERNSIADDVRSSCPKPGARASL